jgi:exodeoxyribonuclease-3
MTMSTTIITCNVNGIRSAASKGFLEWLAARNADHICLQEVRANDTQAMELLKRLPGYRIFLSQAEKAGYSGVAVLTKQEPIDVQRSIGHSETDHEGRILELRFPGFTLTSAYFPSGSSGEIRQAVKYDFMDSFMRYSKKLKRRTTPAVLCGDFNIAHKEIDLKNWRSNQKNSGFLPDERAWMDELLGQTKYIDSFRVLNDSPDQYTWWSNRGQAYAKNVGWRLDYQLTTPTLRDKIQNVEIFTKQRFSDHAPYIVTYDL